MSDLSQFKLHRTVVLVGMMGSGKTAIGRNLAARLSVPFLDSDAAIEEAAAAPIADIFARDGEAFFRARETEVIRRLLAGPPGVLSTGGGAFLSSQNQKVISQMGVSVWLDAALTTLWDRVRHKDTRPLLRTDDPLATLTQIFDERTPIYAKACLRVDVDAASSIDETTNRVLSVLAARADVLEAL